MKDPLVNTSCKKGFDKEGERLQYFRAVRRYTRTVNRPIVKKQTTLITGNEDRQ